MTKSNFTKVGYDVISVTSSLLHYQKNVTKLTLQGFQFWVLPIKISGYASDFNACNIGR